MIIIRKGKYSNYVNLTKLVNLINEILGTNKKYYKWELSNSFKELVKEMKSKYELELLIKPKGLPNELKGTYGHPILLFNLYFWMSPVFAFKSYNKLATIEFGSKEEKTKLVSNMYGVSVENVTAVLNKLYCKLSCIYLISIGSCENLQIKIENANSFIYKFGTTEDIERRIKEHNKEYSKLKGSKIELIAFSHIDPTYKFKAETTIRKFFIKNKMKIEYEKYDELVCIPNKSINKVKKKYEDINKLYNCDIEFVSKKLEKKNNKIQLLKKDNELLLKEIEIMKKDKEIAELKLKNYIGQK